MKINIIYRKKVLMVTKYDADSDVHRGQHWHSDRIAASQHHVQQAVMHCVFCHLSMTASMNFFSICATLNPLWDKAKQASLCYPWNPEKFGVHNPAPAHNPIDIDYVSAHNILILAILVLFPKILTHKYLNLHHCSANQEVTKGQCTSAWPFTHADLQDPSYERDLLASSRFSQKARASCCVLSFCTTVQ